MFCLLAPFPASLIQALQEVDLPSVSEQDSSSRGESRIDVSVSQAKVQVAEPFRVALTINVPEGTDVSLPQLGSQLGPFDVIEYDDIRDIPIDDGWRQWTRTLTLESISTGDLTIPAFEIELRQPGANASAVDSRLRSQSLRVTVVSALEDRADPTQFRDIQSVVDLPTPTARGTQAGWWLTFGLIGSLIAGIGLIAFSLVVLQRRRPRSSTTAWAHQQLLLLQTSKPMREGDAGEVVSQLTSILNRYLQSELEDDSSRTTGEWFQVLRRDQLLPEPDLNRLESLSHSAELVKFAGIQRTREELFGDIDLAMQFVDRIAAASLRHGAPRTAGPTGRNP